jgi:hypothetical protein
VTADPHCYGCRATRGECWSCRKKREQDERIARVAADVDWYERTGHCGGCGQPAVAYCVCTPRLPCGCHERHPMGAGLADDALDAFAEVTVPDGQGDLFGGAS